MTNLVRKSRLKTPQQANHLLVWAAVEQSIMEAIFSLIFNESKQQAENELELVAKDIWRQPTSQYSTPASQNLDLIYMYVLYIGLFVFFICFGSQKCVSPILPEKCLTGVG